MSPRDLPMSVLIPTRRGWPAIKPTIDAVASQAAAAGAELVVVDASGRPAPADLGAHVRWVACPTGASVFELRSHGYREARGDIVAVTEDHCRVDPDWCASHLQLHRENPDAVVIAGSLRNGTPDHMIDWGAFLVTQSPSVAPRSVVTARS